MLSDELPDSPTTAETTSASVDNLLLVAGRDSDIAFALAVLALGLVVHFVLSRGGPDPAGTNDRP